MAINREVVTTIVPLTFIYNYRVGKYMERYIQGLAEKKILAVKCPKCKRAITPPRSICGVCNTHLDKWIEVGPEGVIENFTTASVNIENGDVKDLNEPVVIGMIKLKKANSLVPGIVKGIKPDEVKRGLKVRAVFRDEIKGNVNDLDHYEAIVK